MSNSRILLVCKHCGEDMALGKGYFGEYMAYENMTEELNEFYQKHRIGECTNKLDFSDDAKNHFVIIEECDELEEVISDIPQSKAELLEWQLQQEREYNETLHANIKKDKETIVRQIFGEIDELLLRFSQPTFDNNNEAIIKLDVDIYAELDELEEKYI